MIKYTYVQEFSREKRKGMKLGNELRRLRKSRRLTLAEVSEAIKLSVSFLSDVERGRTKPSLDTLEKLATYYKVSVNNILKETEFGTSVADRNYPPSFEEFLQAIGGDLEEDKKEFLLRAENRSNRRIETKEDWMQLYYSLKSILRW